MGTFGGVDEGPLGPPSSSCTVTAFTFAPFANYTNYLMRIIAYLGTLLLPPIIAYLGALLLLRLITYLGALFLTCTIISNVYYYLSRYVASVACNVPCAL